LVSATEYDQLRYLLHKTGFATSHISALGEYNTGTQVETLTSQSDTPLTRTTESPMGNFAQTLNPVLLPLMTQLSE
jgi:hypothetical protein